MEICVAKLPSPYQARARARCCVASGRVSVSGMQIGLGSVGSWILGRHARSNIRLVVESVGDETMFRYVVSCSLLVALFPTELLRSPPPRSLCQNVSRRQARTHITPVREQAAPSILMAMMNDLAMRFGLFGGPAAGLADEPTHEAYEEYVDYVVAAEALGFHSVFLTEHHFTGYGQASSPLTLLAHIAARTHTLRLGTGVAVLPWHNPLIVAEQAATVDVLSKGRLDFGVGRGFRASEFTGFGLPMDDASKLYEEALGVILEAWTASGRWTHKGESWTFENILVEPAPIQVPTPPVWIGAGSEQSISRAADKGFKLLLDQIGSFEKTGERVTMYSNRLAELGRPFSPYDVAVTRSLHIVDGPRERARAIAARANLMAKLAALANAGGAPKSAMAAAFSSDIEEATEHGSIIGDIDECVERLERLQAEGVGYVLLVEPENSVDVLRTFAEEIAPRVGSRVALRGR